VHGLGHFIFPGGYTSVTSTRLKIEDNEGEVCLKSSQIKGSKALLKT
jgi:hypothetical protein